MAVTWKYDSLEDPFLTPDGHNGEGVPLQKKIREVASFAHNYYLRIQKSKGQLQDGRLQLREYFVDDGSQWPPEVGHTSC